MKRTALLLSLLATLVAGCAAETQAPPSTPETRAAAGAEWFHSYCASCHGISAAGDGPVADYMTTQPANLTRIAALNGGVFDKAKVAAFIDGRERLAVHGSPEMPVWGRALDDRSTSGFYDETLLEPGIIYLIVEYLESIQTP
jgi:mono/diheme cytochrome c family protein